MKVPGKSTAAAPVGSKHTVTGSDYVTGAFFATVFSLFRDSGGFDRGYRPVYFEELDYCLRLREAGWKVVSNTGGSVQAF